jgi:hypothetical protein
MTFPAFVACADTDGVVTSVMSVDDGTAVVATAVADFEGWTAEVGFIPHSEEW